MCRLCVVSCEHIFSASSPRWVGCVVGSLLQFEVDDEVIASMLLRGDGGGPLALHDLTLPRLRSITHALKVLLKRDARAFSSPSSKSQWRKWMRCFLVQCVFTTRTNNTSSFKIITRLLAIGKIVIPMAKSRVVLAHLVLTMICADLIVERSFYRRVAGEDTH